MHVAPEALASADGGAQPGVAHTQSDVPSRPATADLFLSAQLVQVQTLQEQFVVFALQSHPSCFSVMRAQPQLSDTPSMAPVLTVSLLSQLVQAHVWQWQVFEAFMLQLHCCEFSGLVAQPQSFAMLMVVVTCW